MSITHQHQLTMQHMETLTMKAKSVVRRIRLIGKSPRHGAGGTLQGEEEQMTGYKTDLISEATMQHQAMEIMNLKKERDDATTEVETLRKYIEEHQKYWNKAMKELGTYQAAAGKLGTGIFNEHD